MAENTEKRLLTEREAAEYLNVSRSFLRAGRCASMRKGNRSANTPAFIRVGCAIRYAVEDLEAWIARNRCNPNPEEA